MPEIPRRAPHRRRGPARGLSPARRRGLARLAVLVVIVVGLIVIVSEGPSSSGGSGSTPTAAGVEPKPPPSRLRAAVASARLPTALHGATATASGSQLLVIGGADRQEVSTDQVVAVSPGGTSVSPYGTLVQALHDAAAAGLGGQTL